MMSQSDLNCTALTARESFVTYIQTLRDETGNNFPRLDVCKADVCNALWGIGNSDISGIGVCFSRFCIQP
jgi:hypothetical protein